ncbi:hypothetical protein NKH81_14445 [Mesorhizobium sp. M0959]|uniref:hypothetical protein n=1 Tax=unclassified Mesorhizobium TaxID=325217 RepID=UPI00333BC73E
MDRKLAAILALDVVGYSALMEHDEQGTFERVKAGRKELFEPEIARHHGHIFKRHKNKGKRDQRARDVQDRPDTTTGR